MPGPTELSESEKGHIAREVRKQTQYMVPHRAFVTRVYEHAKPGDAWNHEVDVVLLSELADANREFEVPVATDAAGDVSLPNDVGRNFDLSEREKDPETDDEDKQPTEKEDTKKPDKNEKNVDDRPECLVQYINGSPDAPVVTDWLYTEEVRSPIGRVNDRRHTVGDWVNDLRADENDQQYAQMGVAESDGGKIVRGLHIPPEGDPEILGADGQDMLAALQQQVDSATGGGGGDYSGTGPAGELPDTDPSAPPAERASQAGIKINNTVQASSTSDIGGQSNTLYVVSGTLTWNGEINLGGASNVAICGENGTDAKVKIPGGYRDFAVKASGSGVMWSGIDLDQSASGAWGRINLAVSDGGFVEYCKTIGSGRLSNPNPNGSYGGKSGPALHVTATSKSGTSRIKNVGMAYEGVMANKHYGDRPIGVFLAGNHKGTLNMVNTTLDSFPNNGVYATNTTGSVHATDCTFTNNGVAQYRIAYGSAKNCTIGFDYNNTALGNADAGGHASQGIAVEDKGKGSNVVVDGCSVTIANMKKCGGGIDVRSGFMKAIKNTDVHMHNVGGAPDVVVDGRCASMSNVTMEGTASSGVSLQNNGPRISASGLTFDYPGGRSESSGPVG